jgi:beta-glucosidase
VTFYRSVDDLPAFTDYSMAHRTYRYFDGPVLYPFGYGLSYSRFSYGPTHLSSSTVRAGQPLTVKVTVRNEGKQSGTDVAELYLRPPQEPGAPRLALKGFQRVSLQPGETREVTFTLTPSQMSTVDAAGTAAVRPGTYRLFLGSTQPDLSKDAGSPFIVERQQEVTSVAAGH